MAYGRKVSWETLREVAFGGIGAGYATVGAATSELCRQFSIYNSTDQDIYVSFDGIYDNLRIASGTGQVHDCTTNKTRDDGFFVPLRTYFYVKRTGAAPTSGNVWIQVMVASGGI